MSIRNEQLASDGSAEADVANDVLQINLENTRDRWRYRCPYGHVEWEPTNRHGWCRACARNVDHDDEADPEFWEILDTKSGELIDWADIDVVCDPC